MQDHVATVPRAQFERRTGYAAIAAIITDRIRDNILK